MQYLVLGPTEVRGPRGEAAEQPGGGRVRALLTVLAAEAGRAVSAERLIDEVWGEEPPADAQGALHALVGRLRRTLGREAVRSEPGGGGYRLAAEPDSVDVHLFERLTREGEKALAEGDPRSAAAKLTRALGLWRGPAFADLPDRAVRAARPEALHRTAQKLRFDAELALGHAPDILPDLREAVLAHPLDESLHALLITALRAQGGTADALMAYEEARRVLAETLGADPGPELRALHAELLARPPDPAPGQRRPRQRQGNLRSRLTSFVGREAEVRDIRLAVTGPARLVTLTGPGGSGKTRLAQEAAEAADAPYTPDTSQTSAAIKAAEPAFPDGVWLAELAPLDDPAAIPHAVLTALGRRDAQVLAGGPLRGEQPHTEDPLGRLLEHCARRSLLLVLDNCEHLIAAAAHLTAELLAACPGVTVLATSREPLGVPGELVRPVEPLPPPTAHRLFAERAAIVRPGQGGPYPEAGPDAAAVREICRRLDGLPLAIELAAARLRALTPRQIADRLDDRFRLLTSGSRTVLPRQQTLRAVVDWSWELLAEPERAALCALSVFAGGCTLPAAEAVCGPDALETVAQLVEKSLVIADVRPTGEDGGRQARYRLLETIHEYAAERAAERPEALAEAARRHTAYYRDLVRTADAELRGPDQLRWLEVLETELDNVRAALHRTVEAGQEADAAAIALGMGWFWWLRNYRDEADGWLERVVALADPPPDDRADPLYETRMDLRMLLFFVKSDHAAEDQLSTPESRETAALLEGVYRGGGPAGARFPGLLWPFTTYVLNGGTEALLGGTADMRWHTEEVVANCREHGDDWALAAALLFRTHTAVDSPGGLALADACKAELAALSDRLADRWIRAQTQSVTGEIALARGDYATARACLESAHRLGTELGAEAESAFLLARLAELAHRDGDDETAAELLVRADEAAEHYSVWDARTYVRYLTAILMLRRGEVAGARQMCEDATGHATDGTPPPIFRSLLTGLSARITAAEGRPYAALAEADLALRLALAAGANESVLGGQIDLAAEVLAACGEAEPAAVLLAAADTVRTPLPRSRPEEEAAAAVAASAAAALPEPVLAAARKRGAAMDGEQAAAMVQSLAATVGGAHGGE